MIRTAGCFVFQFRCRRDFSAVAGGGRDGAGVHQAYSGKLSLGGLGAFAVWEIPGGVPQGKAVVCRHVSCAEARAAEARLQNCAAFQQGGRIAVFGQLQADGNAGGIYVQGEIACAAASAPQDVRRFGDVVKQAAGTARNHALIGPNAAVMDFIGEADVCFGITGLGVGLHLRQNFRRVIQKFPNGPGVGRVEGQRDHRLHFGQVNFNVFVIPGKFAGMQFFVFTGTLMGFVEAPDFAVRFPDRGKAGGFGGHDIDPVSEVNGQQRRAGTGKFQNAVVYKTGGEGSFYQGDRHVMRADAALGSAGQIDKHDFGVGNVPSVFQKLLGQFRAAFPDGHRAQRAVAGVGIRTKNHFAAARQLLPRIGMDDALVGGDIDTAVFFRGGEAEDVIVLVDCAADGAEAVMAVGQSIGHREFLHSGGASLLDDADVGDIVAHQGVKANFELFRVFRNAVGLENTPCQGFLFPLCRGKGGFAAQRAVFQKHAVVM